MQIVFAHYHNMWNSYAVHVSFSVCYCQVAGQYSIVVTIAVVVPTN